jgi:hypothetical protein
VIFGGDFGPTPVSEEALGLTQIFRARRLFRKKPLAAPAAAAELCSIMQLYQDISSWKRFERSNLFHGDDC